MWGRIRLKGKSDSSIVHGEISGWVFIAIGLAIIAVSIIMNMLNQNKSMTLFIIAGIIMTGWGIGKYFFFGSKGVADLPKPEEVKEPQQKQHKEPNKIEQQILQSKQKSAKHCPHCGYALNPKDNFCYNCGADVRNL